MADPISTVSAEPYANPEPRHPRYPRTCRRHPVTTLLKQILPRNLPAGREIVVSPCHERATIEISYCCKGCPIAHDTRSKGIING
jgi:hypothetical protein